MNFICWIGNKEIRKVHGKKKTESGISFKILLTNQKASLVNTWLRISCFQSVRKWSASLPSTLQGRVKVHRYRWWIHQPFLRFNKDKWSKPNCLSYYIIMMLQCSIIVSSQAACSIHLCNMIWAECHTYDWPGCLFGETIVVMILFWQDCHSSLVPSTKLTEECTKKKWDDNMSTRWAPTIVINGVMGPL